MLSFPPWPPAPWHRPDWTGTSRWSGRPSSSSSSWRCPAGRRRCRTRWWPPSPVGRCRSNLYCEPGLQRAPVNYNSSWRCHASRYCKQHVLQLTHWFDRIVQTKVQSSEISKYLSEIFQDNSDQIPVDKDTRAGDPKPSVKPPQSVSLDSLDVAVYDAIELSLTGGVPGVHTQPGAGVVDTLDEQQGERASAASGQDVFGELLLVGGVFGNFETFLNFILKSYL